jgi:hypothetical protein
VTVRVFIVLTAKAAIFLKMVFAFSVHSHHKWMAAKFAPTRATVLNAKVGTIFKQAIAHSVNPKFPAASFARTPQTASHAIRVTIRIVQTPHASHAQ